MLSPSTRLIDLNLERARLEAAGCGSSWVVDPLTPSLVAWELHDGAYGEPAVVTGDETFASTLPFPLRLTPSCLLD